MTTTSSLTASVLLSPDILPLILIHLPQPDILTAQRVCHFFSSTIAHNATIQRHLFFLPDTTSPFSPTAADTTSDDSPSIASTPPCKQMHKVNPALASKFHPFFTVPTEAYSSGLHGSPSFNDLLQSPSQIAARKAAELPKTTTGRGPAVACPEACKALLFEGASWRKMLVTQPPIREIEVLSIRHGQIGDSMNRLVLSEQHGDWEGGLTMGTLYDVVCEHLSAAVASFAVDWTSLTAQEHAEGKHGVYGTLGYQMEKGLEENWKVGEEVELVGGKLMLVLNTTMQCRSGEDRRGNWVREWECPGARVVLPGRKEGRWKAVEGTEGGWRWRGLLP